MAERSIQDAAAAAEKRAAAPADVATSGGADEPWAIVLDPSMPDVRRIIRAVRSREASPRSEPADGSESAVPTRRSAPWLGPLLVALGTPPPAEALEVRAPDGAFERPVDVERVVRFLEEAAGRPSLATAVPATAEAAPSSQDAASATDDVPPDDFPVISGLPELESILPELDPNALPVDPVTAPLSQDIEGLLEASAQRMQDARRAPAPRPPAEADPILVSQEMLASLDELLIGDEEGGSPSGGSVPLPPLDTGVARSVGSAPTPSARMGTGHPRAPSERSPERTDAMAARTDGPLASEGSAPPPAPATPTGPSGSSIPPEFDSRSSVGSLVHTEQRPVSSQPPSGSTHGPAARTPMPLPDALPIPSPTIGTVQDGRHSSRAGSMPTYPDLGAATSQPAWPATGSMAAPWHAPPDAWSSSPSGLPLEGAAGATEPPRTHLDPLGPFPTAAPGSAPPPEGLSAGWPTDWPRPSSMPPPQTWADVRLAAPSDTPPIEQPREPTVVLAEAIARRATGALAVEVESQPEQAARRRWIVLRDGDIVTATSELVQEGLVHFLVARGDLGADVAELHASRLPHAGRHAAAALIAHGFLGQDELWPVLRAHAEWLLARAMAVRGARCHLQRDVPERLQAEPNVFGGAAGVEVFIEAARRVLSPNEAIVRLGGRMARLVAGPHGPLLAESALSTAETEVVRGAVGSTVGDVLTRQGADFAPVLHALVALQVLASPFAGASAPAQPAEPAAFDPLDVQAVRERVRARLALVREADYFSLLGVTTEATDYEIRRAFVGLRRTFEPARLITAATADLADDVRQIVDVLEEAYQILRDPHRRSRYRNAILETAPQPASR